MADGNGGTWWTMNGVPRSGDSGRTVGAAASSVAWMVMGHIEDGNELAARTTTVSWRAPLDLVTASCESPVPLFVRRAARPPGPNAAMGSWVTGQQRGQQ
jgi:hypothetical protein